MVTGKATIVLLTVGSIKKTFKICEYFPEPKSLGGRVKIELYLSNYAAKTLKKCNRCWLKFAKKVDLANLKSNVDKIN